MARVETHLISAPCAFLGLSIFQGFDVGGVEIACSMLGSILPDIDHKDSVVGRAVPLVWAAKAFGWTVEHRGFFHSIFFVMLVGLLTVKAIWAGYHVAWMALLISQFQHLVIDGLSLKPLRLLRPFSHLQFRFSPNSQITIPVGSGKERRLAVCLFLLTLGLGAVVYIEPRWILNAYFRDCRAGVEYYHEYGDRWDLTAKFIAKELQTGSVVAGDAWKVEGFVGETLVLLDGGGRLWSMTNNYVGASMRAETVRLKKGERIRVERHTIDMARMRVSQLARLVDATKVYQLHAKGLVLAEAVYVAEDAVHFAPVRASGRRVYLAFARLSDLAPLGQKMIEQGMVEVVYKLREGEQIVDMEPEPSHSGDRHEVVLKIANRAELWVAVGDTLTLGDTLAVHGDVVKKSKLVAREMGAADGKLAALDAEARRDGLEFESKQGLLEGQLKQARQDLADHERLAEAGMVASQQAASRRQKVEKLEADLKQLELGRQEDMARIAGERVELQLKIEKLIVERDGLAVRAVVRAQVEGVVGGIAFEQKGEGLEVKLLVERPAPK